MDAAAEDPPQPAQPATTDASQPQIPPHVLQHVELLTANGWQPGPGLPPFTTPEHIVMDPTFHQALAQARNLPTPPVPPQAPQAPQAPPQGESQDRHPDSEDSRSGSENEDSEDDDELENRWHEVPEDKSTPSKDELAWIESKEEHSALEHEYWQKWTFNTAEMEDPELVPSDSARIDWLVERYNGTRDNPNHERIMRSQTVKVGGYEFQIKFFPKGDRSEYLSVYLECVTMASPDYEEFVDLEDPPFPFLKGMEKIKKRHGVAVQFSIVVYNPEEPRSLEFMQEQHQFCKKAYNHGWRHFSDKPRYDFYLRQHGQRQPLIRNDKLAFKAYIRMVNDPTGCQWIHDTPSADQMTSLTGLRPFSKSFQYIAVAVPLLHFAPFRRIVQRLENVPNSHLFQWLHTILVKMYTRKRSTLYGTRSIAHEGDVMEMLWRMCLGFQSEYPETPSIINELIGAFHAEKGSACGTSRLNTKDHKSIQAAVDNHHKVIARPQLLTLELQRQEHDKKDRRWKKLTHKVKVDERLTVGGTSYTLYAFITHKGQLQSSQYNSYVRPRGFGKGWYAYRDSVVKKLTEKQARDVHSGTEKGSNRPKTPEDGYDSPFTQFHHDDQEVTCAVMYVRDDVAHDTFNVPDTESWVPSQPEEHAPPKTSIHEVFPDDDRGVVGSTGQRTMSEEEYARACTLRERIDAAAVAMTPEPIIMDGEDVVMKDADDDSAFSADGQETPPTMDENLEVGTLDWLGRAYYEGHWKESMYHGGGHLIALNGDEYIGQFSKGQKSGYGKMIYSATGDVYEGEWKDDQTDGKGKLIEHATGNVYEGNFTEGRRTGKFVYSGSVTEEDKTTCKICYDKEISTAFYDCGHVVACRECAAQVDTCPVCRKAVMSRLQLFGVRISQT